MILYNLIQLQKFIFLIQIVIGYEISHRYSGNNNNNNNMALNISDDDLILLRTKTIVISDIDKNQINGRLRTDINDFIELIPIDKVKNIVGKYYNTDNDVKRACTYLDGKDFTELKDRILRIHQVQEFLKYLNRNGLDIIGILNTLLQMIGDPKDYEIQTKLQNEDAENSTLTTGLHGLVDDVLDTLPQDQILSLFFDKLETSDNFSDFINNIGSEEFSNILDQMKESRELRNLVYTLHNNGIYIDRIIDSLKAYFFFGTF